MYVVTKENGDSELREPTVLIVDPLHMQAGLL